MCVRQADDVRPSLQDHREVGLEGWLVEARKDLASLGGVKMTGHQVSAICKLLVNRSSYTRYFICCNKVLDKQLDCSMLRKRCVTCSYIRWYYHSTTQNTHKCIHLYVGYTICYTAFYTLFLRTCVL